MLPDGSINPGEMTSCVSCFDSGLTQTDELIEWRRVSLICRFNHVNRVPLPVKSYVALILTSQTRSTPSVLLPILFIGSLEAYPRSNPDGSRLSSPPVHNLDLRSDQQRSPTLRPMVCLNSPGRFTMTSLAYQVLFLLIQPHRLSFLVYPIVPSGAGDLPSVHPGKYQMTRGLPCLSMACLSSRRKTRSRIGISRRCDAHHV